MRDNKLSYTWPWLPIYQILPMNRVEDKHRVLATSPTKDALHFKVSSIVLGLMNNN